MKLNEFLKSNNKKQLIGNTSVFADSIIEEFTIKNGGSFLISPIDIKKLVKELSIEEIIKSGEKYSNEIESVLFIYDLLKNTELEFFKENQISLSLAQEFYNLIQELKLTNYKEEAFNNNRLRDFLKIFKLYNEKHKGIDYGDSIKIALNFKDDQIERAIIENTDLRYYEEKLLNLLNVKTIELDKYEFNKKKTEIYRCFSQRGEVLNLLEIIIKEKINPKDIEIVYTDASYIEILKSFLFTNLPIKFNKEKEVELVEILENIFSFVDSNFSPKFYKKIKNICRIYEDVNIDFIGDKNNYLNLSDFAKDLVDILPAKKEEKINFRDFLNNLLTFSKKYLNLREEVVDLIKNISSFSKEKYLYFYEALEFLKFQIENLNISKATESFIRVSNIYDERIFTRKYAFILGMASEFFPTTIGESPVIRDSELEKISKKITTKEKLNSAKYNLAKYKINNFFSLGEKIYFSYPQVDEKNEKYTEAVFLQNLNLPEIEKNYYSFDSLEEKFQELRENNFQEILKNFVFSATSLNVLNLSPKCFYNKFILNLDDDEEEIFDEDLIFPFYATGSIVHESLKNIVDQINEKGSLFALEQVENILNKNIEPYLKKYPQRLEKPFENYKNNLRDMIKNYLIDFIEKNPNEKFYKTEYSFGFGQKESLCKDPVTIEIGKYKIKVKGSIDRLDLLEDQMVLIDYKTGNSKLIKDMDNKNRLIQDFIYKKVLEKFFSKDITCQYHFIKNREIYEPCGDFEETEKNLELLFDFVNEYGFVKPEKMAGLSGKYENLKKDKSEIEKAISFSENYLVL